MNSDQFVHYLTHDASWDAEHFRVISLMNVALHEYRTTKSTALVEQLSLELAAHYANEESIMAAINYPYLQSHEEDHIRVLSQMNCISRGAYAPTSIEHLSQMFITHIDNYDLQLSSWINSNT